MNMQKIMLSLAAMIIILAGCKTKRRDLIVNKWRINNMSGDRPDRNMQQTIDKTVIEFTADGKYILSGTDHDQEGTYKVSDDGRWLVITTAKDFTDSSKINLLTKNTLRITHPQGTVVLTPISTR